MKLYKKIGLMRILIVPLLMIAGLLIWAPQKAEAIPFPLPGGHCYTYFGGTLSNADFTEVECVSGDVVGSGDCIVYNASRMDVGDQTSVVDCANSRSEFGPIITTAQVGSTNVPQLRAANPDIFNYVSSVDGPDADNVAPDGSTDDENDSGPTDEEQCQADGGVWDGYCAPYQPQTNDCQDANVDQSNCGIIRWLVILTNVLSTLAGIVIVGAIIAGGIQYSSAGSDPQKVSAAKNRIRNAIIALLLLLFGYGLLNFLIPGGVL